MLSFNINLSIIIIFFSGFLLTLTISNGFNKIKEDENLEINLKKTKINQNLEELINLEENNNELMKSFNELSVLFKKTEDQENFKINTFIKEIDQKAKMILIHKKKMLISKYFQNFSPNIYKEAYKKIKDLEI